MKCGGTLTRKWYPLQRSMTATIEDLPLLGRVTILFTRFISHVQAHSGEDIYVNHVVRPLPMECPFTSVPATDDGEEFRKLFEIDGFVDARQSRYYLSFVGVDFTGKCSVVFNRWQTCTIESKVHDNGNLGVYIDYPDIALGFYACWDVMIGKVKEFNSRMRSDLAAYWNEQIVTPSMRWRERYKDLNATCSVIASNFSIDMNAHDLPPVPTTTPPTPPPVIPSVPATTRWHWKTDNDEFEISYAYEDNSNDVIFAVKKDPKITWWKGIKVFAKDGNLHCLIEFQDEDDYKSCNKIAVDNIQKVELWKGKAFDIHTHMEDLPAQYYQSAKGLTVTLKWLSDR